MGNPTDTCADCGTGLAGRGPQAVLCTACLELRRKRTRQQKAARDREIRALLAEDRACATCGTMFQANPSASMGHKYCSARCRNYVAGLKRRGKSLDRLPGSQELPECEVRGCRRLRKNSTARWCNGHYIRWYRYGDPLLTQGTAPKPDGACWHCNKPTSRGLKYCSTRCENRSRSGKEDVSRRCRVCQAAIPDESHLRRAFCSSKCKNIDSRARNYGITGKDYLALYQAQDGKCAVCGDSGDRLFLDHCHVTGAVRGLLCPQCNAGLGMFKEDRKRLEGAIAYLARSKAHARRPMEDEHPRGEAA